MRFKTKLLIIGALCGIGVVALAWDFFRQNGQRTIRRDQRIGQALAESAAALTGKQGRIVVICEGSVSFDFRRQFDSFKSTLRVLGDYELREDVVRPNPRDRPGCSFSGSEFVRIARQNSDANVFVSFAGAPLLTKGDEAILDQKAKLVVEAHSWDSMIPLFDRHFLDTAVVLEPARRSVLPHHRRFVTRAFAEGFEVIHGVTEPGAAATRP